MSIPVHHVLGSIPPGHLYSAQIHPDALMAPELNKNTFKATRRFNNATRKPTYLHINYYFENIRKRVPFAQLHWIRILLSVDFLVT